MDTKHLDDDMWVDIVLPGDKKKENKMNVKPSGTKVPVKAKVTSPKGTKSYVSAASAIVSPYVQTAMQSLSVNTQPKLPPKQRVYIHCVRHAQVRTCPFLKLHFTFENVPLTFHWPTTISRPSHPIQERCYPTQDSLPSEFGKQ
jgi:hypothetical protein